MRILIVEDEPDLLSALSQALREDGYAVDPATDGREGLFKAKSITYDAIILDLMLPQLDGWGVLQELRRAGHTVPVLILTARDALPDRVRGLDAGADDYLVKPYQLKELLARLRALIRRSAGKSSSVLQLGPVAVDTAAKRILKDGQPVVLTAREYALVEFLALHRGKMLSRTEIYDHLFDEEDDSLSNLLDVHVCNVRKKLGKNFILTRRGQGYTLGEGNPGAPGGDDDV